MAYTVVAEHTFPSGDLNRAGRLDRVVVIEHDDKRRETYYLPNENYGPDALKAAVAARQTTQGTLLGRHFE